MIAMKSINTNMIRTNRFNGGWEHLHGPLTFGMVMGSALVLFIRKLNISMGGVTTSKTINIMMEAQIEFLRVH
jgi:hypothetical protein